MVCWTLHYAKRLLETLFVHRFSHATMPLSNLFKNCSYYWGFAAFVSYYLNHPLYTPPGVGQFTFHLLVFQFLPFHSPSLHSGRFPSDGPVGTWKTPQLSPRISVVPSGQDCHCSIYYITHPVFWGDGEMYYLRCNFVILNELLSPVST
jgi:hypothetical protein